MKTKDREMIALLPLGPIPEPLEELEARLEGQVLSFPLEMDDDNCLYYLCTTRCSGAKCPVFCACDTVINKGG